MAISTQPKRPAHLKKRQAQHHRRSKRYMKPYWPYLPMLVMLLVIGFGLLLSSFGLKPQVLGSNTDLTAEQLLSSTNQARTKEGIAALNISPQLAQAAQAKAEDLVTENYWAHTSPSGKTPWQFIAESGYQYQAAGENLAYGFQNARQVVVGWLNSPEHRANVLSSQYRQVGFGVASATDYLGKGPATVVVAEYAEPADAVAHITFQVNNPAPSAASGQVKGDSAEVAGKRVALVQELTGGAASWSLALVSGLAGAAIAVLLINNSLRIHRMVSRGEEFVAHHPWFDASVLALALICYLLSHTVGLVR